MNEPYEPHLTVVPPDDPYDTTRPLPHDIDAERAMLGAILMDGRVLDDVQAVLEPDDIYRPNHELIYTAATQLYAAGDPIDLVTVADRLAHNNALRRAGGAPYLHQLTTCVATPANAAYHARIVAEQAQARRLVQAGTRITELGYSAPADAGEAMQAALDALAKAAPTFTTADTTSSWSPVNLAEVRRSDRPRPTATLGATTNGQGLLYPGAVHSVSGEPTAGKSWLSLAIVAQEVAAGHPVAYLDFEDRAETLIARLDDLGANPDDVDRLVRYIRPEVALTASHLAQLDHATADTRVVIVDGVTEAMTLHDLDLSSNPDIAAWLKLLPHRIAHRGPAVLQVDHVVKDAEHRGRYAIGGQHKLAGITGAAYTMVVGKPFGPNKAGHARVIVSKDRHGDVGTVGDTVAELHMAPDPSRSDTAVKWALSPSTYNHQSASGGPRLTGYMEKVSRILEVSPGMAQKDLLTSISGKESYITKAVASLVEEGFLRVEKGGPGRPTRHFMITPFREDAE